LGRCSTTAPWPRPKARHKTGGHRAIRSLGGHLPTRGGGAYATVPRVLRTPLVEEWLGRTQDARREAGRLRDDVLSAIQGRTTHELLPFTGQTAGMVHDVLPTSKIVQRMVAEAELAL
jgi:enoyl-[acyl-carrier protein] reductase II